MKKTIIALSILFGLLLVLLSLVLISEKRAENKPGTNPYTEESVPNFPEVQVQPDHTAQEAPEIAVMPLDDEIYLNGKKITTVLIGGQVYTSASGFAEAANLSMEGDTTLTLTDEQWQLSYSGEPVVAQEVAYLPYQPLTAAFDYPKFVDEETGVTYYTPSARRFEIPQGIYVPVLMYHAVGDEFYEGGAEELFVSPSSMEEQLRFLADNGYQTIFFEDLSHLEDFEKPVLLTFDDGYDDNYTNLFPLLQKYNAKATVFVIGNAPGTPNKMTAEQIREMSDSGLVSIQSHSYTHPDMDYLDAQQTEEELTKSKLEIIRITGKEPYVFCYPTGRYNDFTLALAPNHYMFGIKMNGGLYNTSEDPFLISRYYISRYLDIGGFASMVYYAGSTN